MNEFKISIAKTEDSELLVRHRLGMWKDIRPEFTENAKEMEETTRRWIRAKLSEGKIVGFIAKTKEGTVAGSSCIWLREDFMSMYTEEDFRRTGVASMIVQCAIDWSRVHGYKTISLHASEVGIPLYERFGFKQTTEMRLML